MTFRMGENETGIDFVLIKKEHRRFIQNVNAIPWEFQHILVVAVVVKKKIMRKICAERRKITLLKDVKIRKRFKEKVTKSVDVGVPNMWGNF